MWKYLENFLSTVHTQEGVCTQEQRGWVAPRPQMRRKALGNVERSGVVETGCSLNLSDFLFTEFSDSFLGGCFVVYARFLPSRPPHPFLPPFLPSFKRNKMFLLILYHRLAAAEFFVEKKKLFFMP